MSDRNPFSGASKEWPVWKCALLAWALCSLPLAFALPLYPTVVLMVWVLLLLFYLGMVRMWGSGFVVEGTVIVLIMAVAFSVVAVQLKKNAPGTELMETDSTST